MSQSGLLVYYSEQRPDSPHDMLLRLFEFSKATDYMYAVRTIGEDRSWQCWQNGDYPPDEALDDGLPIAALASHYKEPCSLKIAILSCPLSARVATICSDAISEDVRRDFIPSDLSITIGYHDLFEDAEHDEGYYIARPFCSVSFFGYETPKDWQEYRRRVFAVPGLQQIERELAEIIGPTKHCVYWTV